MALLVLGAGNLGPIPAPLAAQSASTLAPLDPAYDDLAWLASFGLAPRGLPAQRPFSVARVARVVREARGWMAAGGPWPAAVERDLNAVLDRLELRFGDPGRRASLLVEGEVGGGESPAHAIPENGVGNVDALLNPLWSYRGGRAYGDRATAAVAARGALALGSRGALGLGGRGAALRSTGLEPSRDGATVESAYVRAALGPLAIQVGRDAWTWSRGGPRGSMRSANGPPLDMVRISTDRPVAMHLLGDVELDFVAADLGPNQNFPYAKLLGARVSSRPSSSLELGVSFLNKQGGDGAPEASLGDRLKDLSFVWDLFRESNYRFSDKMMGMDVLVRVPDHGLSITAEAAITDFEHRRLQDTFVDVATYDVGVELGRLGASQRHTLGLRGQYSGAVMYRHHQFTSGAAVDGFLTGSALGPDGRAASLMYRYHAPAAGWRTTVLATGERRRVDRYRRQAGAHQSFERIEDLPDEVRFRLEVSWLRSLSGGRGGVELRAGVERVDNPAYEEGRSRGNGAALLRVWRAF